MTEVMNSKPAISSAAEKLRDGAVQMKEAVVSHSSEVFGQACEQTQATIKANPYRSVLVAFGVGALLGAVLFRR